MCLTCSSPSCHQPLKHEVTQGVRFGTCWLQEQLMWRGSLPSWEKGAPEDAELLGLSISFSYL